MCVDLMNIVPILNHMSFLGFSSCWSFVARIALPLLSVSPCRPHRRLRIHHIRVSRVYIWQQNYHSGLLSSRTGVVCRHRLLGSKLYTFPISLKKYLELNLFIKFFWMLSQNVPDVLTFSLIGMAVHRDDTVISVSRVLVLLYFRYGWLMII